MILVTIRHYGRHVVASAVAGAVLAVPTVLAPVAHATPVAVPVQTRAQTQQEAPLSGAGLTGDWNAAFDLEALGVVVAPVGGAIDDDGSVANPVGAGSKLSYGTALTGGTVHLRGGIQLTKGSKKITVTNLTYDIKTGELTGKVGDKANVRIATNGTPDQAEVVLRQESTIATLKLGQHGLALGSEFLSAVDSALGTTLATEFEAGTAIEAVLDVDVDLATGSKLNAPLIIALGLAADVDPDTDSSALLDLDLDLSIDLF